MKLEIARGLFLVTALSVARPPSADTHVSEQPVMVLERSVSALASLSSVRPITAQRSSVHEAPVRHDTAADAPLAAPVVNTQSDATSLPCAPLMPIA